MLLFPLVREAFFFFFFNISKVFLFQFLYHTLWDIRKKKSFLLFSYTWLYTKVLKLL